MKYHAIRYVLIVCMACWVGIAHAGPWSKDTGQLYVKASQGFFVSGAFVDQLQKVREGADFFGTQTSIYYEVGLLYGLQLQGSIAYGYGQIGYQSDSSFFRLNGPSDAVVGLQWTPPPLRRALGFPMAVRVNVKVPLYDAGVLERDPLVGPQSSNFPALGDGQIDTTFWLSLGGSIPNTSLYAFAEIGYRLRTESFIGGSPRFEMSSADARVEFLDTFVFQAQVGWAFWRRMLLLASLSGAIPLGANDVTKGSVSVGIGVYLPIYKGLAFEASFDPMVWAQASARGVAFSAGLSYQL